MASDPAIPNDLRDLLTAVGAAIEYGLWPDVVDNGRTLQADDVEWLNAAGEHVLNAVRPEIERDLVARIIAEGSQKLPFWAFRQDDVTAFLRRYLPTEDTDQ